MMPALLPLCPTSPLAATAGIFYTCKAIPNNRITIVNTILLTNTDSASRTATLYNVPAGGTPSAANSFMFQGAIAAGNVFYLLSSEESGIVILTAGGTIQALADVAAKVNITMSGREYT